MKLEYILLSLIINLFLSINICAQNSYFEKQIAGADSLWKTENPEKAAEVYEKIISEFETVPPEFHSLVYIRLAELEYQLGKYKESLKAISSMRLLPYIPAHHFLMAEEIEEKINGTQLNEITSLKNNQNPVLQLYVSQKLNENIPGKNRYKTIEEALFTASALIRDNNLKTGPIEILIEDEFYRIDKPVTIEPQFSGTEKNPIIIKPSDVTKKVIIDGGVVLKNWKKETNPDILARLPEKARKHVITADFNENGIYSIDNLTFGGFSSARATGENDVGFKTFPVPELFYEGTPQTMARWPNNGDTLIALNQFKGERVLKWADETDLWFHGYWKYLWADAYEKFKSVSLTDTVISLMPPFNTYGFNEELNKWHAVNALSEIDMPGEWHLSTEEGKIRYFPPVGFNPDNSVLSVFKGPAIVGKECNYITIENIELKHIRGNAMAFTNCSNLSIINCDVENCSGTGITIDGGKRHLIYSCRIESMGAAGINIYFGNISKLESSESIIENCTIRDLSRIDRTYRPAILLQGIGIKVRHCLFSEIPSSAIRLEGNDMLVEMNEFSRCVIESDDQGAIDVFYNPLYQGNIIRWNFFHDIGIPDLHMAAGVRLDDAICGFSIYENIFLRSSNNLFGGVQIHGGKDNYIEGNIFSDCHAAISQSGWGDKRWKKTLNEIADKQLKTYNWQNETVYKRYPGLKNIFGEADINYATNNLLINGESMILRKSPKFQSFNNKFLTTEELLNRITDYEQFSQPWQNIPFDKIGTY